MLKKYVCFSPFFSKGFKIAVQKIENKLRNVIVQWVVALVEYYRIVVETLVSRCHIIIIIKWATVQLVFQPAQCMVSISNQNLNRVLVPDTCHMAMAIYIIKHTPRIRCTISVRWA